MIGFGEPRQAIATIQAKLIDAVEVFIVDLDIADGDQAELGLRDRGRGRVRGGG